MAEYGHCSNLEQALTIPDSLVTYLTCKAIRFVRKALKNVTDSFLGDKHCDSCDSLYTKLNENACAGWNSHEYSRICHVCHVEQ